MRGALIVALVLGVLVAAASGSDAASVRYATADATVAVVNGKAFGVASSRREGADEQTTTVERGRVSVGEGLASTDALDDGAASAEAGDVALLDGRITARSVTRSAGADGVDGEIAGLRIDGRRYGIIRNARTLRLGIGERLVLNTGTTGLRLVTPELDVRLAVVEIGSFTRALPDPTRTPKPEPKPKPTRKPKPTPSPTPTPPATPPRLTAGGYAFPVVGEVNYTDTFGADRQAAIGTHQGVDIFGEFGAPAVAVRDGRLIKVGTLPISGNRLWVIADNGDAFFYAHLSSFSTVARTGARVQAGDVLGFVGNTGDAEPTPPHLHFEVHPGGLNQDAVNPTPIVRSWERSEDVPPGAWAQRLSADATERPGALVTVRDFIAE